MKKRSFILPFLLLAPLASCQQTTTENKCPEPVECPTCPECPGPTIEEVNQKKLLQKAATVQKALDRFNGDFSTKVTFVNSRSFDNILNVINNSKITYTLTQEFDRIPNTELVRYKADLSSQRKNDAPIVRGQEEGVYNIETNVKQFEYLDYKNTVQFRDEIKTNVSAPVLINGSLGHNVYKDLKLSAINVTLEEGPLSLDAGFLSGFLYSILGFNADVETAQITLTGDQITKLDFKLRDFNNKYTDKKFMGDEFVESLSGTVEFTYKDVKLEGKKPVAQNKKQELEDVLAKFRASKDNYTITYGAAPGFAAMQVLQQGDKTVVDCMDLFVTGEVGTLSWLDARVEKDATKGKYFVNNLTGIEEERKVIDETTGKEKTEYWLKHAWKTNYEVVDESINVDANGQRLPDDKITAIPDELVHFDKSEYELDFANIDTSILTKETDGSFTVKGDSARYFGECLMHQLPGSCGFVVGTDMNLDQFGWTGTTWTLKVVDPNTISFEGVCDLGWEGSSAKGSIFGTITNAGTTDTAKYYVSELPADVFLG